MGRYSSDSESSSVKSRSRRRRTRSSSSSDHRKNRSSYRSKHSSSRHSRSHKSSRHRSNERSKRSRRSHSRERSKKKSDRNRRRSHSRDKYSKTSSRKRSSSTTSSSSSDDRASSRTKPGKSDYSGDYLRNRLLQTLKNASEPKIEETKAPFSVNETVIKFDLDAINEIEADSFVPKAFKSSKNALDVGVVAEKSVEAEVVAVNSSNPPPSSFIADDSQIKFERWIKKLYNIRQKALNGDSGFTFVSG